MAGLRKSRRLEQLPPEAPAAAPQARAPTPRVIVLPREVLNAIFYASFETPAGWHEGVCSQLTREVVIKTRYRLAKTWMLLNRSFREQAKNELYRHINAAALPSGEATEASDGLRYNPCGLEWLVLQHGRRIESLHWDSYGGVQTFPSTKLPWYNLRNVSTIFLGPAPGTASERLPASTWLVLNLAVHRLARLRHVHNIGSAEAAPIASLLVNSPLLTTLALVGSSFPSPPAWHGAFRMHSSRLHPGTAAPLLGLTSLSLKSNGVEALDLALIKGLPSSCPHLTVLNVDCSRVTGVRVDLRTLTAGLGKLRVLNFESLNKKFDEPAKWLAGNVDNIVKICPDIRQLSVWWSNISYGFGSTLTSTPAHKLATLSIGYTEPSTPANPRAVRISKPASFDYLCDSMKHAQSSSASYGEIFIRGLRASLQYRQSKIL